MSDYQRLDITCMHCGGELAAKWGRSERVVIQGAAPIDFVHIATGAPECWVRHEATPYSIWQANSALKEAEAESE